MLKKSFVFLCAILIFASSCKSTGKVEKNNEPLDYSQEDVVRNEISRIKELLPVEPVEAYWRSILLGDEEVIENCISHISRQMDQAIENKDYVSAWRFAYSLEITGKKSEQHDFSEIDALFRNSVPGFLPTAENKKPKSVSDCVNAAVTVIVDKGIKISGGSGFPEKVLGSGFFIDSRGYVVTNHHVISDMVDSSYEGYSRLYIKLPYNEDDKIPAKVIGYDSVLDLALLKAEIEPKFVLSLGSSEKLSVGEKINVIGAPLGLENSISEGIISNTKRNLFTLAEVFQVDASVNSGNSGGPCIDRNLQVQAVVFAGVLQAQGLNFAIPIEYLKQELPFLYAGGEINHCWTGCFGTTKKYGGKKAGVEIQYVMPGSSALLSGLKAGQTVTSVNGNSVDSVEQLQGFFRNLTPGTIIKIEGHDESGKEFSVFTYLQKRGKNPALDIYESDLIENAFLPLYGMKLVPASTTYRNSYKIVKVLENSDADEMQFSENDPLTIKKTKIDKNGKYIATQIITKRHKKNLIDIAMVLGSPFDSANYF